jgi:hypothetical protein
MAHKPTLRNMCVEALDAKSARTAKRWGDHMSRVLEDLSFSHY